MTLGEFDFMPRDVLHKQAELRERIRKFEVIPRGRRGSRSPWVPNREARNIIAGFITLLGAWKADASYSMGSEEPFLPPYVPDASRALFAIYNLEGAQFGAASKFEWTDFLSYMKAIPSPFWVNQFNPFLDPATGVPVSRTYHTMGLPAFPPPTPLDRTLTWAGLPPKTWGYVQKGSFVSYGGVFMPAQPVRDLGLGPTVDGGTNHHDGGGWHLKYPPPDPVSRRIDHIWYTGIAPDIQTHPCVGPNEPAYNSIEYPGQPNYYLDGPDPCYRDSGGIAVSASGDIERVFCTLPGDNIYLHEPVRPHLAGDPLGSTVTYNYYTYPGMNGVQTLLDSYLSMFPVVEGFFERTVPIAQAMQAQQEGSGWDLLELVTAWSGTVGVQLVTPDRLLLRGQVTYSGTERMNNDFEYIGTLVNPRVGEPPLNATAPGQAEFLAPVEWSGGTSLELFRFGKPFNRKLVLSWERADTGRPVGSRIARSEKGPFTINFDGIGFPVRYTPPA